MRVTAANRSRHHWRAPRTAFTLIELLVVISIVALLMALLMPTLQRVRKQARAVACQVNLRQWGTVFAAYAAERDGRIAPKDPSYKRGGMGIESGYWWNLYASPINERAYAKGNAVKGILCCPMATKGAPLEDDGCLGGTFRAWCCLQDFPVKVTWTGSYGMSRWILGAGYTASDGLVWGWARDCWDTTDTRNACRVPVIVDSTYPQILPLRPDDPPPPADSIPTQKGLWGECCINRHEGGINGLFMDWSVRKIGLKELWTLKWSKTWDTAGKWTKAGGVQPEDWPEWMRGFKDY